ncbi:curli-like amyloid fiber formation chaperone CsgH [Jannaschia pohangensis]|nr:curli-like amyloid fiber formation chaperone CsgH [Jannaschia pohangensis]
MSDHPTECRIEASGTGGITYLTAIVASARPLRGTASLSVDSRGAGGRSSNTQRASFAIDAADGQAIVGRVGVSSGSATTVTARLTATWDGGQTSCAYP